MGMYTKEKESTILSFISYFFLLVILVAVFFVMYLETREPKLQEYPEPFHVPKADILTKEEVNKERYKIQQGTKPADTQEVTVFETDISPENVTISPNNSSQTSPKEEVEVRTITKDDSTQTAVFTNKRITYDEYETNNSSNIAAYYEAKADEPQDFISINGSIHQIDLTHKRLVIVKENQAEFGIVRANENTDIKINGKSLTFSSLKIGDKISAEGYGFKDESDVMASTILVTGSDNIF